MKTIDVDNKSTIVPESVATESLSLAMMLHEIRSPLTTILLALSHLEQTPLPPQSEREITLALREAQRLRILLEEGLFLCGSSQLQLEVIELNNFFGQIQELIFTLPITQNHQLLWRLTPCPILIQADRHQLIQVLINLLTNACQAAQPGTLVSCFLDLDSSGQFVWIRVHNSGTPIQPEILSHLTEPFFTTKDNGTGLGLAIVARIVRAHCGELTIESKADGTTVSFCLPLFTSN